VGTPHNGPFIGGGNTAFKTDIDSWVYFVRKCDTESWMGFTLDIPYGPNIEQDGFGAALKCKISYFMLIICYRLTTIIDDISSQLVKNADRFQIVVKLPLGGFEAKFSPVVPDVLARLPANFAAKACLIEVTVKDITRVSVERLGVPFSNPGHIAERWLNGYEVAAGKTLEDILCSTEYKLVVPEHPGVMEKRWAQHQMPPKFEYP
jgi:hypothetical protein